MLQQEVYLILKIIRGVVCWIESNVFWVESSNWYSELKHDEI
jgi:hypothetical protein